MTKEETPSTSSAAAAQYRGRRVALLTQHGKERVIAPTLAQGVGCLVERIDGYDTDQLGTFTREIKRPGTQVEAARRKARIGMDLANLPLGIGSEGSFGPDPMVGMFPWNVEVLVFIDEERALELIGIAQGNAIEGHLLTGDWTAVEKFARRAKFPVHHLVVRPDSEADPRVCKGLADWAALRAAFERAKEQSTNGLVFLENDLRAHANPTRMEMIRQASEDLAAKLLSSCPSCGAPGFWIIDREPGLPCAECGLPTRETKVEVLGCVKCAHQVRRERLTPRHADPGRCDRCNP